MALLRQGCLVRRRIEDVTPELVSATTQYQKEKIKADTTKTQAARCIPNSGGSNGNSLLSPISCWICRKLESRNFWRQPGEGILIFFHSGSSGSHLVLKPGRGGQFSAPRTTTWGGERSWGWNQERSLPCLAIGGWHGSSPEWLGTVRELSSSNEDKTDYLFTVPIEILKGCSCKTVEDVVATNLPRGMDALPSLVLANNWHRSSYPRVFNSYIFDNLMIQR